MFCPDGEAEMSFWQNVQYWQLPVQPLTKIFQKQQYFRSIAHQRIRSCVENEWCCPRTVNISNVNFTKKKKKTIIRVSNHDLQILAKILLWLETWRFLLTPNSKTSDSQTMVGYPYFLYPLCLNWATGDLWYGTSNAENICHGVITNRIHPGNATCCNDPIG